MVCSFIYFAIFFWLLIICILGIIYLHRLSWAKAWEVSLTLLDQPVTPELMTWHPEGLFLVVTAGIYDKINTSMCNG